MERLHVEFKVWHCQVPYQFHNPHTSHPKQPEALEQSSIRQMSLVWKQRIYKAHTQLMPGFFKPRPRRLGRRPSWRTAVPWPSWAASTSSQPGRSPPGLTLDTCHPPYRLDSGKNLLFSIVECWRECLNIYVYLAPLLLYSPFISSVTIALK